MRTILLIVAILTLFYSCISAYQITFDSPNLSYDHDTVEEIQRERRQLESFDDEYPTASNQNEEEPGFWDRIVKSTITVRIEQTTRRKHPHPDEATRNLWKLQVIP